MKTWFYFLVAFATLLGAVSCGSGSAKKSEESKSNAVNDSTAFPAEVPVEMKTLSGYFLKNDYILQDSINFIVLKDNNAFNAAFGIGKTMTNTIESPDFANSVIMAIALKSSDIQTNIQLNKAEKAGSDLNVYATITKGEKQTFTSTPAVIFSAPKNNEIVQVQLFINGQKIKAEKIK